MSLWTTLFALGLLSLATVSTRHVKGRRNRQRK
jgi:hypothetical protein